MLAVCDDVVCIVVLPNYNTSWRNKVIIPLPTKRLNQWDLLSFINSLFIPLNTGNISAAFENLLWCNRGSVGWLTHYAPGINPPMFVGASTKRQRLSKLGPTTYRLSNPQPDSR
jgi:hypothetical protein